MFVSRKRFAHFFSLLVLACLLRSPILSADQTLHPTLDPLNGYDPAPPAHDTSTQAAVASDRFEDPAATAAREILRQQGSIVDGREQLQNLASPPAYSNRKQLLDPREKQDVDRPPAHWPHHRSTHHPVPHAAITRTLPRVTALREAAWQLETTAHRLENMELYGQADALRGVATRLRHDARKMKAASHPTETGINRRAARRRSTTQPHRVGKPLQSN